MAGTGCGKAGSCSDGRGHVSKSSTHLSVDGGDVFSPCMFPHLCEDATKQ